jgi:hypothetical protein
LDFTCLGSSFGRLEGGRRLLLDRFLLLLILGKDRQYVLGDRQRDLGTLDRPGGEEPTAYLEVGVKLLEICQLSLPLGLCHRLLLRLDALPLIAHKLPEGIDDRA